MNLGKIIRNKRVDCDMSQQRLAQMTNVTQTTISRIENNEVQSSFKTMVKILEALNSSSKD